MGAERQNYTMTQADYDQIIERITAARNVSGMFLSGGMPMGNPQEAANEAWCELGRRMGFDGMTVRPAGSKLQFTAVSARAPVAILPEGSPEARAWDLQAAVEEALQDAQGDGEAATARRIIARLKADGYLKAEGA